jgi:hypothetical protein
MKPGNLRLQLPIYGSASVFSILLLAFIINACKKADAPLATTNEFNADAAKEWWYGSFKKSADYFKIDRNSPLAPPLGSSIKKYPAWKSAISYSIGRLQIVELPLVYETNSILLPGMQKLYNTPEGARIAKSATHKLMLIKKADGTVAIRTVTLVPSPEYAKQYNYDISHISLKKLPSDFSGYQMIGGWDENEKNILRITAGKPDKKLKIITAQTLTRQKVSGNSPAREACDLVWVPNLVWVCVVAPSGDDLADQERCREQGSWVEQGGSYELQCNEEPGDPMENCLATGGNYEDCMCELYGLGCDGGGGGGDDPPCNVSCQDVDFSLTPESEVISSSVGTPYYDAVGNYVRKDPFKWFFSTNRLLGWTWRYKSFEETEAEKVNGVWKFTKVTHKSQDYDGTLPPCIGTSITMNSATDNILDNGTRARMDLDYKIKVNVICCPLCPSAEKMGSSYVAWPCSQ